MTLVELWRWRYRDPNTGSVCRTTSALCEQDAGSLPEAVRIPGTLRMREVADVEPGDFADTVPEIAWSSAEHGP